MGTTELYEKIASAAHKVRADIKATDVDISLSDGTVIRREGDSRRMLTELDEIIAFVEA